MPISVFWKTRDAKGDVSTREVYLPVATTAAAAVTFAGSFIALIDDITSGEIVSAGVNLEIDISGLTNSPVSTADLQEMARFAFRDAAGFLTSITIPTFPEVYFLAGTNQVDTAQANVAAFITAMEDGLAGTSPTSLHEDDLTALETAVEAWGNARR